MYRFLLIGLLIASTLALDCEQASEPVTEQVLEQVSEQGLEQVPSQFIYDPSAETCWPHLDIQPGQFILLTEDLPKVQSEYQVISDGIEIRSRLSGIVEYLKYSRILTSEDSLVLNTSGVSVLPILQSRRTGETVIYLPDWILAKCEKNRIHHCRRDLMQLESFKLFRTYTIAIPPDQSLCQALVRLRATKNWKWVELLPVVGATF